MLNFQALNKPKMGTSLCDVTMTLKRQEKNGNIFFLKQDTFFYKKMYFCTRKCMFDTFTPKFPRDYTAAYTNTVASRKFEVLGTRVLIGIISSTNYMEVGIKLYNPPK